jgi:hypothetical protein
MPYLVMQFSGQLFLPLITFGFQTVFGSFRFLTIKWLTLTVLVFFKLHITCLVYEKLGISMYFPVNLQVLLILI